MQSRREGRSVPCGGRSRFLVIASRLAVQRVFSHGNQGSPSTSRLGRWSLLRTPVLGAQGKEISGSRTAHAEAKASESVGRYGGHIPKVSERIIDVTLEELTLLDALKRAGVNTGCPCPVHGRGLEVCMGNCAVLVATEWLDSLPPRTDEETDVIKLRLQSGASPPASVDKHFRLSCLLQLGPQHEGMKVGLTEPVAAETP
ncbi:hypothetical protein R1flu_019358 [Riccia fluitans]|uniref:Ferredoxin n=1 Tax=Riccia fluitans TaxID=41844 RepID=A0ABD1ZJX0_9MARC